MSAHLTAILFTPVVAFIVYQYGKVAWETVKTAMAYRHDPHEALAMIYSLTRDTAVLVAVTTFSKVIGF